VRPTANDSHPDGIGFSLSGTPVSRGADIKVNGDGSLSFTPPDANLTTYTFTYTIQDTAGKTASAQIIITVVAKPVVNRAPSAKDDRADAAFGASVTVPVLANDSDPDNDPISLVETSAAVGGTASVSGSSVVFTPSAGFSGLGSFSYTIADAAGLKATAKAIIQVADRPKLAPLATNDAIISIGGARVSLDPLVNDSDPDGTAAGLIVKSADAESDSVAVAVAPRLVRYRWPHRLGRHHGHRAIPAKQAAGGGSRRSRDKLRRSRGNPRLEQRLRP
jgi:Bacterial Ig domain